MKLMMSLLLSILSMFAIAADMPYDEAADASAAIKQALVDARSSHKAVLLVFGANWCGDCRALDHAVKTEKNADLIAKAFEVVKINVGEFDKNQDIADAYGNPIKNGIPAVVIVSAENTILYSTKAGELANARRMNEEGVYGFFKDALQNSKNANWQ